MTNIPEVAVYIDDKNEINISLAWRPMPMAHHLVWRRQRAMRAAATALVEMADRFEKYGEDLILGRLPEKDELRS